MVEVKTRSEKTALGGDTHCLDVTYPEKFKSVWTIFQVPNQGNLWGIKQSDGPLSAKLAGFFTNPDLALETLKRYLDTTKPSNSTRASMRKDAELRDSE